MSVGPLFGRHVAQRAHHLARRCQLANFVAGFSKKRQTEIEDLDDGFRRAAGVSRLMMGSGERPASAG